MEVTAQQLDSVIVARMECVMENIICNLLNSKWAFLLQHEWNVLE